MNKEEIQKIEEKLDTTNIDQDFWNDYRLAVYKILDEDINLKKEIVRLKNRELELSHHLSLYSSEETMLKEIERLNNIINEIINMIKKDQENMLETPAQYILNKIQELKGDGSNDSKRDV